MSKILKNWKSK